MLNQYKHLLIGLILIISFISNGNSQTSTHKTRTELLEEIKSLKNKNSRMQNKLQDQTLNHRKEMHQESTKQMKTLEIHSKNYNKLQSKNYELKEEIESLEYHIEILTRLLTNPPKIKKNL